MKKKEIARDREKFFHGELWHRLVSPPIMEVLKSYTTNNGTLFGITGDLDNLGVHVARQGRAEAECLVDEYNQIIRNYIKGWAAQYAGEIFSVAFIPSGEEVFILGVVKEENTAIRLFEEIRSGVMSMATDYQNRGLINIGKTAASFGGVVYGNENDSLIRDIIADFDTGKDDQIIYPNYRNLLITLRTKMAQALDEKKFQDILNGLHPVQLRLIVYKKMLEYKQGTKLLLQALNALPPEDAELIIGLIGDPQYGLDDQREKSVEEAIRQILNTGENR